MRITFTATSLLLASLLLPACKGTEGDSNGAASRPINKANLTECLCGTPEADVLGCTAACCLGGPCDNPLCTCEHESPAAAPAATQPAVQKMDGTGYTGPGSAGFEALTISQTAYQAYVTKDGKIIKGAPIKREGDRIRFKMPITGGGSVESLKSLSDFSPHSAFNILRKLEPGHDLESHAKLAKFALENGLIAATRTELRHAAKYAKKEGRFDEFEKKVKIKAAEILKGLVNKAIEEGDAKKAYRFGSLLFTKLPDQMTTAEKEAMLSRYEKLKADQANAKRTKKEAEASAARSKADARILKPIEDRIAKAEKRAHKGLVGTSNQSKSLRDFNGAAKDFQWAMKKIQKEQRKSSNALGVLSGELRRLEQRARQGYIDAHLNAGSIYLGRSSLNKARNNVNAILAVDPKNGRAISMRGRIEIAGNTGWGWGAGYGGSVGR